MPEFQGDVEGSEVIQEMEEQSFTSRENPQTLIIRINACSRAHCQFPQCQFPQADMQSRRRPSQAARSLGEAGAPVTPRVVVGKNWTGWRDAVWWRLKRSRDCYFPNGRSRSRWGFGAFEGCAGGKLLSGEWLGPNE